MGCPPSEDQVNIVQGQDKEFFVDLFYTDTGEPFDLTNASEIKVLFPGTDATIVEKMTDSKVVIQGAPGAGKIKVICSAADTALMQVNPSGPQFQDLQVNVTLEVVVGEDTEDQVSIFILSAVLNIIAPAYTEPEV